jgi:hypothetical protein
MTGQSADKGIVFNDLEREQLAAEFPGWCLYLTGVRVGEFRPHARRNGPHIAGPWENALIVSGKDWTELRDAIIHAEADVQGVLRLQRELAEASHQDVHDDQRDGLLPRRKPFGPI